MNTKKLDKRRKEAQKAWEAFENNKRPLIYVGAGTCGRAAGAMETWDAARETLDELGVKADFVEVGCIGPCYLEPLMDVKLPGKSRLSYANVSPSKARTILTSIFEKDEIPDRDLVGYFGDESPGEDFPRFWDHPMLKSQVRLVPVSYTHLRAHET